jgi:hypothetical protein
MNISYDTEGSKTNIPCGVLLARQVRATFASDSRMTRASGVNLATESIWRMLRAKFAYDVRHVPAYIMQMLRARLPRATRDVTFGPLCTHTM